MPTRPTLLRRLAPALALAAGLAAAGAAAAQTQVPFGGLTHDSAAPVEVSADQLNVNQADGSATFSGNVVVGQGALRLSAGEVRVEYATGQGRNRIARLHASGGVTLATPTEAAEAREARYDIDGGQVVLTGDVLVTQGQNALSGDRMVIDLAAGTGRIEGRVRTILQPGGGQ